MESLDTLREEYVRWRKANKYVGFEGQADYWIEKIEAERAELREKVEGIDGEEVPVEDHECHKWCCGRCWCEDKEVLIKKSSVLALLTPKN